jgi:hypothetical protein
MNQDSQPEIEGLRREVARIIDPRAWELEDAGAFQGFPAHCALLLSSLGKADAVLALLSLKEGGGLSSSCTESAALLASQASCSTTPSSTGKEDLGRAWHPIESAPTNGDHLTLWLDIPASARSMGWADAFAVRDCWWLHGRWVHTYRGGPAELDAGYITHWAAPDAEITSGPAGETLDWWRA